MPCRRELGALGSAGGSGGLDVAVQSSARHSLLALLAVLRTTGVLHTKVEQRDTSLAKIRMLQVRGTLMSHGHGVE